MKMKKSLTIIAIAVIVAAITYYLYISNTLQSVIGGRAAQGTTELNGTAAKEVSATATYETPGGSDTVRFTLGLDTQGTVVSVKSSDALKNDEVSTQLAKFSENLLLVIKGKKLSELKAVDKVGTSSLTTAAFNTALSQLQAQL